VNVFRVGFGYDAHRLVEGRSLILGGVKIPHQLGLLGHSDADVLTHAIVDAILGALVKGDMGQHFPDSDPAYKDMDSLLMLRKVMEWVKEDGFRVNQVDTTIVAEAPKLAPSLGAMKQRLSEALAIKMDQINIKATTSEGMGFCGRQDGMEAYAVVSLIANADCKRRILLITSISEAPRGPAETGSPFRSDKPRGIPLYWVNWGHGGLFSKPRRITPSASEKLPSRAAGEPLQSAPSISLTCPR
jgi:2-C-methyl-D-erythritol 2,4-cyclodiphosphate synthase